MLSCTRSDRKLASKMEPLLAGKWKVLADPNLTHEAKVKAVKKTLGIPDPTDRLSNNSRALLQETARLTHASTLAFALLHRDAAGNPGVAIGAAPTVFTGALDDTCERDPDPDGPDCKYEEVALKGGKTYDIHMQKSTFDNCLRLKNSKNRVLMEDDDSGGGLNGTFDSPPPWTTNTGFSRLLPFAAKRVATSLPFRKSPGSAAPVICAMGFPVRPFPFPAPTFDFPPPRLTPAKAPSQPVGGKQPQPGGVRVTPAVDQADLANLREKVPTKTRVAAFHKIVANLPEDLTRNDITARHAKALARHLLTITIKTEADEVAARIVPAARSRAVARTRGQGRSTGCRARSKRSHCRCPGRRPAAAVRQGCQLGLQCRQLLLIEALENAEKQRNPAAQTADIICNQYREQGILLGVSTPGFQQLRRPALVIESVIKHLAGNVEKQNPAPEQKAFLDQLQCQLLVAQFVAANDLEHTVMLQRIWLKVLSIYLEQRTPQQARQMRQLHDGLDERDRLATNVL